MYSKADWADQLSILNEVNLRPGHYTGARAKAWRLLIHAEASLSLSLRGGRARAWRLLTHAGASLSHGGQGKSLVPAYTRGSVYLTGGGARALCLLIHAEAHLSELAKPTPPRLGSEHETPKP